MYQDQSAYHKPFGTIDGLELARYDDPNIIETEWRRLQRDGIGCIYQSFDWVQIAAKTFEADNEIFIVTGRSADGLEFLLPMVITRSGLYPTLRWIGENHANVCSGLYSRDFFHSVDDRFFARVFAIIKKELPVTAVITLKNQLELVHGRNNPFKALSSIDASVSYFQLDITPGMQKILSTRKRKGKTFRRQVRITEQYGGYELFVPKTPEEIDASVDHFFEHKAKRLKALGIKDVFKSPGSRSMIRKLAHAPMRDGSQPFRIVELKIGGKTRAMYGISVHHKSCQCNVNSVTYDELSYMSPGEMVLYLMIEQFSQEGFEKFDIGVGNERYKRSWCKEGSSMFVNIEPVTLLALPFAIVEKARVFVKRKIRRNSKVWSFAKKARKQLADLGLRRV